MNRTQIGILAGLAIVCFFAPLLIPPTPNEPRTGMRTFSYKGHDYIEKDGAPISPFVHDPDCSCQPKTEEP